MGSTIDFFSTLDVDDDVNELLELHQQQQTAPASLRLPPTQPSSVTAADAIAASLTARDLLSRMQVAAQVMHGHQQQQAAMGQRLAAVGQQLPTANVLVDGLMDDDWGSSDLFEVGSPDNPVPAQAGAAAGAPAVPLSLPTAQPQPTMADLAAAYWHGRATGAAAAVGTAPAVSAPALPFGTAVHTTSLPSFASGISPSAHALTASIATANALATTEALNAQLLSHLLQNTDGNSSAAAGAALGGSLPASLPYPSFGATTHQAVAAPILSNPIVPGLAAISSPSFGAGDAYAALVGSAAAAVRSSVAAAPSAPASAMAAGPPSRSHLAARDVNTASSLLESRLELASALANNSSSVPAAATSNSASEYLSSMLELDEDILESALDGAESIGTIHSDDDSEDGMPTLEDLARPPTRGQSNGSALSSDTGSNGGPGGDPSAAVAVAPAVAASSVESANNDVHEEEDSKPPAAASAPPPRRSRRQAAVRGLERISTALATHGMGGNDGDENVQSNGKIRATASRKKPPTIIPKPSNKSLKKEESEEKEEPTPTCCICLEEPTPEELASISGCSHPFCFTCIEKWADQENKCPLCKARFLKIDKVNKPKKRKGGAGSEDTRSSKRVRNRDQRSDIHSFVNPLEGIFASMEANGTWPTHIAQLLFSGLGGSTFGRSARPSAASAAGRVRRSTPSIPNPPSVFASAAAQRQQQRQAAPPTFRYQPPSSRAAAPSAAAAGSSQISNLLQQVRARQNQRLGGAFAASSASPSSNPFAMNPPPPVARPPVSRALPFPPETSPWATSTPVSVTLGAQGFAAQPPAASATSFQAFSNPLDNTSTSAVAASSPLVDVQEEVDLLSTMSPSSYISRLHREFDATARQDRPTGQYQFNSSTRPARRVAQRTPGVMHPSAPTPSDNPFSMFSSAAPAPSHISVARSGRGRNQHARAAGRTVETALEIAESDDDSDIVEVIDVEALI